ncbi:MAG: ketoacyl-ACP synthase III [Halanaerobiales bacterium]|nr:ketoacyl-ACP synthase III [Halanaerobiales bacterium]
MRAGITGIGSYLPEKIMTNFDLEKIVDTTDEWIRTRTGIIERRIASDDEATSDLAIKAANRALEDAGVDPEDLDMIICATVTPDYLFPATACLLQEKLGAKKAAAFDMEAGCSGFVYALSIASQFIKTGFYKKVLVIGAETLSKITNWKDRSTCVLFGDGAGAAVVEAVEEGGILGIELGCNGAGGKFLDMPAGGSRRPSSVASLEEEAHFIRMDGTQVYRFAVKAMGKAALNALKNAGLTPEDVDFMVPHQANTRIIDGAAKRLKLSSEKVYVNLPKYGNTSSASIPIALDEAYQEGKFKKGDTIVLVGFGAGLTWASVVMEWNK